MKKAGIITLYYKNDNYGGIAQAYALCAFINSLGVETELISYDKGSKPKGRYTDEIRKKGLLKFISVHFEGIGSRLWSKMTSKVACKLGGTAFSSGLKDRKAAFECSRDTIPHSKVYTKENISEITSKYDYFITGSDQVWKPGVVQGAFVFDFLDNEKNVFSYASSITSTEYPDQYNEFMKKNLQKYKWISVRENQAKDYLEKLLNRDVDVVVDPTLLLSREQWDSNCSSRIITKPYLFAYLLGYDKKQHEFIQRIAHEKGLEVVFLPHLDGKARLGDLNFGDVQLYDVDLGGFLSLIKYSDLVCTDSFHATVFSYIFKRDFFVFDRKVTAKRFKMGSRIDTLLALFGLENRKVDVNTVPKNEITAIDYDSLNGKIDSVIELSKKKLQEALGVI